MDASQDFFGSNVSGLSTQTPQAAATTGAAAAATAATTSAVASTALAASPAVPVATGPYYFDALDGAKDIIKHLSLFFGESGLVPLSSCSKVAEMMLKEAIINEWAKLGVTVLSENISPVPDLSLLNPGEFLVLIPKGLTLNALASRFRYSDKMVKEAYGKQAVGSSYWVAVPDKVLEETRDLPFAKQVEIMKDKCPGAQVANVLEICAAVLICHERTGKRMLSDDPPTFTCTYEPINDYQMCVGGFSAEGLYVGKFSWMHPSLALLPLWML
jgi:hypothetical protein